MKQGYRKGTDDLVVGTLESIRDCTAWINGFNDDGSVEYAGETEVNWDAQKQDRDKNGELLFVTEGGGVIPFSQIEFRDDDEEDDEEEES